MQAILSVCQFQSVRVGTYVYVCALVCVCTYVYVCALVRVHVKPCPCVRHGIVQRIKLIHVDIQDWGHVFADKERVVCHVKESCHTDMEKSCHTDMKESCHTDMALCKQSETQICLCRPICDLIEPEVLSSSRTLFPSSCLSQPHPFLHHACKP